MCWKYCWFDCYRQVLARDPSNLKALYRRGQAYKELGQFKVTINIWLPPHLSFRFFEHFYQYELFRILDARFLILAIGKLIVSGLLMFVFTVSCSRFKKGVGTVARWRNHSQCLQVCMYLNLKLSTNFKMFGYAFGHESLIFWCSFKHTKSLCVILLTRVFIIEIYSTVWQRKRLTHKAGTKSCHLMVKNFFWITEKGWLLLGLR